jgi:hypothetical protein
MVNIKIDFWWVTEPQGNYKIGFDSFGWLRQQGNYKIGF